jgi:hypothetical protein
VAAAVLEQGDVAWRAADGMAGRAKAEQIRLDLAAWDDPTALDLERLLDTLSAVEPEARSSESPWPGRATAYTA